MASNPPGECCTKGSLHDSVATGKHIDLYGLNTYVAGTKSDKIIVILTDIFGNKLNNVLLIADDFAKKGYYVLIPDILNGDFAILGKTNIAEWFPNHVPEITEPIVESFLTSLKKDIDYKFLGLVGYCFGAKYAVQQLTQDGFATAAAVAHPSFVSIEEIAAIKKPLLISAAETDSIFTPELRAQTEAKLAEVKARYQLDLFGGVEHGFANRADLSNPVAAYAKEKAFIDQVHWFKQFS